MAGNPFLGFSFNYVCNTPRKIRNKVEERQAVIPAHAENSSQSSFSSDLLTKSSQAASTGEENTKPTSTQDDLRKKMETEKDILLGLYQKRCQRCCQRWIANMLTAMDNNELKNRGAKEKKL